MAPSRSRPAANNVVRARAQRNMASWRNEIDGRKEKMRVRENIELGSILINSRRKAWGVL
jgi:hypothetical protein